MKLLLVWMDIRSGSVLNPHHGLAWLAGSMKDGGHEVRCVHIREECGVDILEEQLKSYNPDCVGFSFVTNQREYIDSFTKRVRGTFDGLIIAGGMHPTLAPDDALKCKDIDGICVGEGEAALVALGSAIDKGESYLDIPSFRWRLKEDSEETIKTNCVDSFQRDISTLPFPDYSIFDMDKVINHGAVAGYMPVMISRGCPYVCTYCGNKALKDIYPKGTGFFRMMTPEQSIDFLLHIMERFPVKGFNFADDLFVSNYKSFSKFAKLYVEKINLPYVCNARVEILNKKEIALLLKESGCRQVSFGIESGDEEYRKTHLKRNYTNEQILTAARLLHEVGLPFSSYNIMGFPFETKEQMEQTVEINRLMRPDSGMIFFFYPYPGTELYDLCEANDLLNYEEMAKVDSFMERPVIKLTNCSDEDCIKANRRLFLYFKTKKAAKLLNIDSALFDRCLFRAMLIVPKLFLAFGRGKFVPSILKRQSI